MEKFKHPLDLSEYITYEFGRDENNKARTVDFHVPDVISTDEEGFVKKYLGADETDEKKDNPVQFHGLSRSGRITHLKAAYKQAVEHNTARMQKEAPQQPATPPETPTEGTATEQPGNTRRR